ncbi:glycosyltransferase family 2 protein [Paraburkholderia sp. DHOC27]|uniref:glycosyltransferase family 2 protein n=1 Tax=Paraburkholderia sp. DHOC27 TaxID=2303330 RepID=UPI000E3E15C7|nr:glycosyltransferase family 2 protein [Paraburkholderia sp. DHOC27]RFU47916.1 glycosyltransferase family 2 protein [Paraburkholderia sp. DHOC27]
MPIDQDYLETLVKVSVIVPTYRRIADLARCLAALEAQEWHANEIVVIARHDDRATLDWLRELDATRPDARRKLALVQVTGVVAAYNLGIETATGDIVCFTDDDAAPHPDWIARIVQTFQADPTLGGLGGRDIVHDRGGILKGQQEVVGLVRWYGRPIGNHHIGYGPPRAVQVLKGVNMAFRRDAIGGLRFDKRLRGSGAQVHCEMAFSLDIERRGWTLIYDPSLLVEHYPAQRSDEDQRHKFNDAAFYNASYNLRLIMCEYLSPFGRWAFLAYSTLIGNRADPGLLRALLLAFGSDGMALAFHKWWVGLRAMRGAWQEAGR